MTPTFYREYREVNRIVGVSLRGDVTLYKILPEPHPYRPAMPPVPIREPEKKPWIARTVIVIGLMVVFWWGVVEAVTR